MQLYAAADGCGTCARNASTPTGVVAGQTKEYVAYFRMSQSRHSEIKNDRPRVSPEDMLAQTSLLFHALIQPSCARPGSSPACNAKARLWCDLIDMIRG